MDVVKDDHVGCQVAVLDNLALFVPDVLGNDAVAAEKQPLHEVVELFALVGRRVDAFPQPGVIDVFQQELCPYQPSQLAERIVQLVLSTGRAQPAENGRRRDLAGLDRNDDAQHVFQVPRDQLPIDGAAEQAIDMGVMIAPVSPVKKKILDVPNAGHQVNSQQMSQSENRCALRLRIAVQGVRLNVRLVVDQPVEDIYRFVDAALPSPHVRRHRRLHHRPEHMDDESPYE